MKVGDHIRIRRGGGFLHGIDLGDRTAIVFEHGVGPRRARLDLLAEGARPEVVTHTERVYAPKLVVARAFSRFSEAAFAAMFADSEAFAVWCKTGRAPASSTSPAPAVASSALAEGRGERAPAGAGALPPKGRARKARPKAAQAARKPASPRKVASGPTSSRRKPKKRPVTAGASAPRPAGGRKAAARPGKTKAREQAARGGAKAKRRPGAARRR